MKQTRHSQRNRVWQVNYERVELADVETALRCDRMSPFLTPRQREVLAVVVRCPDATWKRIGKGVGVSALRANQLFTYGIQRHLRRVERITAEVDKRFNRNFQTAMVRALATAR